MNALLSNADCSHAPHTCSYRSSQRKRHVPGTNRCYQTHYKTGSQSNVPGTFCSRSGNPVYSFTMRDIFQNGIPSPAPPLRRPSGRKCRVWITTSRSPQSQMSAHKKICARRRRPNLTRQSLDLAPKLRPIKRSFSWTRLLLLTQHLNNPKHKYNLKTTK